MVGRTGRVVALAAIAVLSVSACSKGSSGDSGGGGSSATALVSVTPAASSASSAPPASSASPAMDLSGTWRGTWTDTSPDTSGGTFELDWTGNGSELTGTIAVHGTPCLSGGDITGALNGTTITFGVVSGQVTVSYDGRLSGGDSMSGTYSTSCGNAKGKWEASRSG